MGDLAQDDYDPFAAEKFDFRPAPPPPQADTREGLPPWTMGALAQQNYYKPAAPGAFDRVDDAQLERSIVPDRGLPFGVTTPQEETYVAPDRAKAAVDMIVPQSPLEWGLAATGPAGRVAGKVGKIGALAAGLYGSGIDEAEAAGKTAALKKGAGIIGDILRPTPANKAGTVAEQLGLKSPNIAEQYVTDPQRIYKPGIYKDPRVIAAEANAMVAPEHPALKELFGVTRSDLYDISQQGTRQGNAAPNIWQPQNPKGSYAAENIMNPANAQRLLDTLTEARKYPGLEQGMVPWYVMDPAFQRLKELVGPERAIGEYNKFNSMMTPFSASSDVLKEINRGTAARMMAERGQLPDFVKYGGMPVDKRGADFPAAMTDVIPHLRHAPTHTDPAVKWAQTGSHGYGQDTVKIPLYTQASGVPETGFQTAWPVPDAHFTRAVGMSDVRKNAGPGDYMGGSEYRTFAPWFRENVSKQLGIEAVPTQALTWGAYAPQTGVKTPIGAGKLELISQRMWERAKELGVDPHLFRDRVLLGKEHASLQDDQGGMGSLAAQDNYA